MFDYKKYIGIAVSSLLLSFYLSITLSYLVIENYNFLALFIVVFFIALTSTQLMINHFVETKVFQELTGIYILFATILVGISIVLSILSAYSSTIDVSISAMIFEVFIIILILNVYQT